MIKIRDFSLLLVVVFIVGCGKIKQAPSVTDPAQLDSIPAIYPSSKKGVGFVGDEALSLNDLNVSWCYNWISNYNTKPANVEFVPMFWINPQNPQISDLDVEQAKNSSAKTVLSFNEPDAAGITVDQALDLWPKLMETGKRLGSPALTTDNVWDGSWLDKFMQGAKARGYRVDFIAVHWYGGITRPDAVGRLKRHLEAIHDKYNLPIWVTEFGGIYPPWQPDERIPTVEQNKIFIKESCEMMEKLPFVERYAWWGLSTGANETYTDPVTGQKVAPTDRLVSFTNTAYTKWFLTPVGKAFSEVALNSPTPPDVPKEPGNPGLLDINMGFEDGMNGWAFAGWAGCKGSLVKGIARTGNYAVEMGCEIDQSRLDHYFTKATPGKTYKAEVWVKSGSDGNPDINFFNSDREVINTATALKLVQSSEKDGWVKYEAKVTAPDNAAWMQLGYYIWRGRAVLDDAVITEE